MPVVPASSDVDGRTLAGHGSAFSSSFAPGEITHVYQDIRAVLAEYKIIVGNLLLAKRRDEELRALGAGHPEKLKEEAAAAVATHTASAHTKEADLVDRFDKAYVKAATSFTGLRGLDAMASQFSRLRFAALHGDAAQAGLQDRFAAIDAKLDQSNLTPAQVEGMDQWGELKDKLTEVDEALATVRARPADRQRQPGSCVGRSSTV